MREREPSSKIRKTPRGPRGKASEAAVVQALFGVGLDGDDGHTRVTKGRRFVLLGGSADTHEQMQEFAVKLAERMKKAGKEFGHVSPKDLRDLAQGL